MALNKTISTPFGVDTSYHHVAEVTWDKSTGISRICVACFPTKASRDAGNLPIGRVAYDIAATEPPTLPEAYAALKLSPEWAGATDC